MIILRPTHSLLIYILCYGFVRAQCLSSHYDGWAGPVLCQKSTNLCRWPYTYVPTLGQPSDTYCTRPFVCQTSTDQSRWPCACVPTFGLPPHSAGFGPVLQTKAPCESAPKIYLVGCGKDVYEIIKDIKNEGLKSGVQIHFYLFENGRYKFLGNFQTTYGILKNVLRRHNRYYCTSREYVNQHDDSDVCVYDSTVIMIPESSESKALVDTGAWNLVEDKISENPALKSESAVNIWDLVKKDSRQSYNGVRAPKQNKMVCVPVNTDFENEASHNPVTLVTNIADDFPKSINFNTAYETAMTGANENKKYGNTYNLNNRNYPYYFTAKRTNYVCQPYHQTSNPVVDKYLSSPNLYSSYSTANSQTPKAQIFNVGYSTTSSPEVYSIQTQKQPSDNNYVPCTQVNTAQNPIASISDYGINTNLQNTNQYIVSKPTTYSDGSEFVITHPVASSNVLRNLEYNKYTPYDTTRSCYQYDLQSPLNIMSQYDCSKPTKSAYLNHFISKITPMNVSSYSEVKSSLEPFKPEVKPCDKINLAAEENIKPVVVTASNICSTTTKVPANYKDITYGKQIIVPHNPILGNSYSLLGEQYLTYYNNKLSQALSVKSNTLQPFANELKYDSYQPNSPCYIPNKWSSYSYYNYLKKPQFETQTEPSISRDQSEIITKPYEELNNYNFVSPISSATQDILPSKASDLVYDKKPCTVPFTKYAAPRTPQISSIVVPFIPTAAMTFKSYFSDLHKKPCVMPFGAQYSKISNDKMLPLQTSTATPFTPSSIYTRPKDYMLDQSSAPICSNLAQPIPIATTTTISQPYTSTHREILKPIEFTTQPIKYTGQEYNVAYFGTSQTTPCYYASTPPSYDQPSISELPLYSPLRPTSVFTIPKEYLSQVSSNIGSVAPPCSLFTKAASPYNYGLSNAEISKSTQPITYTEQSYLYNFDKSPSKATEIAPCPYAYTSKPAFQSAKTSSLIYSALSSTGVHTNPKAYLAQSPSYICGNFVQPSSFVQDSSSLLLYKPSSYSLAQISKPTEYTTQPLKYAAKSYPSAYYEAPLAATQTTPYSCASIFEPYIQPSKAELLKYSPFSPTSIYTKPKYYFSQLPSYVCGDIAKPSTLVTQPCTYSLSQKKDVNPSDYTWGPNKYTELGAIPSTPYIAASTSYSLPSKTVSQHYLSPLPTNIYTKPKESNNQQPSYICGDITQPSRFVTQTATSSTQQLYPEKYFKAPLEATPKPNIQTSIPALPIYSPLYPTSVYTKPKEYLTQAPSYNCGRVAQPCNFVNQATSPFTISKPFEYIKKPLKYKVKSYPPRYKAAPLEPEKTQYSYASTPQSYISSSIPVLPHYSPLLPTNLYTNPKEYIFQYLPQICGNLVHRGSSPQAASEITLSKPNTYHFAQTKILKPDGYIARAIQYAGNTYPQSPYLAPISTIPVTSSDISYKPPSQSHLLPSETVLSQYSPLHPTSIYTKPKEYLPQYTSYSSVVQPCSFITNAAAPETISQTDSDFDKTIHTKPLEYTALPISYIAKSIPPKYYKAPLDVIQTAPCPYASTIQSFEATSQRFLPLHVTSAYTKPKEYLYQAPSFISGSCSQPCSFVTQAASSITVSKPTTYSHAQKEIYKPTKYITNPLKYTEQSYSQIYYDPPQEDTQTTPRSYASLTPHSYLQPALPQYSPSHTKSLYTKPNEYISQYQSNICSDFAKPNSYITQPTPLSTLSNNYGLAGNAKIKPTEYTLQPMKYADQSYPQNNYEAPSVAIHPVSNIEFPNYGVLPQSYLSPSSPLTDLTTYSQENLLSRPTSVYTSPKNYDAKLGNVVKPIGCLISQPVSPITLSKPYGLTPLENLRPYEHISQTEKYVDYTGSILPQTRKEASYETVQPISGLKTVKFSVSPKSSVLPSVPYLQPAFYSSIPTSYTQEYSPSIPSSVYTRPKEYYSQRPSYICKDATITPDSLFTALSVTSSPPCTHGLPLTENIRPNDYTAKPSSKKSYAEQIGVIPICSAKTPCSEMTQYPVVPTSYLSPTISLPAFSSQFYSPLRPTSVYTRPKEYLSYPSKYIGMNAPKTTDNVYTLPNSPMEWSDSNYKFTPKEQSLMFAPFSEIPYSNIVPASYSMPCTQAAARAIAVSKTPEYTILPTSQLNVHPQAFTPLINEKPKYSSTLLVSKPIEYTPEQPLKYANTYVSRKPTITLNTFSPMKSAPYTEVSSYTSSPISYQMPSKPCRLKNNKQAFLGAAEVSYYPKYKSEPSVSPIPTTICYQPHQYLRKFPYYISKYLPIPNLTSQASYLKDSPKPSYTTASPTSSYSTKPVEYFSKPTRSYSPKYEFAPTEFSTSSNPIDFYQTPLEYATIPCTIPLQSENLIIEAPKVLPITSPCISYDSPVKYINQPQEYLNKHVPQIFNSNKITPLSSIQFVSPTNSYVTSPSYSNVNPSDVCQDPAEYLSKPIKPCLSQNTVPFAISVKPIVPQQLPQKPFNSYQTSVPVNTVYPCEKYTTSSYLPTSQHYISESPNKALPQIINPCSKYLTPYHKISQTPSTVTSPLSRYEYLPSQKLKLYTSSLPCLSIDKTQKPCQYWAQPYGLTLQYSDFFKTIPPRIDVTKLYAPIIPISRTSYPKMVYSSEPCQAQSKFTTEGTPLVPSILLNKHPNFIQPIISYSNEIYTKPAEHLPKPQPCSVEYVTQMPKAVPESVTSYPIVSTPVPRIAPCQTPNYQPTQSRPLKFIESPLTSEYLPDILTTETAIPFTPIQSEWPSLPGVPVTPCGIYSIPQEYSPLPQTYTSKYRHEDPQSRMLDTKAQTFSPKYFYENPSSPLLYPYDKTKIPVTTLRDVPQVNWLTASPQPSVNKPSTSSSWLTKPLTTLHTSKYPAFSPVLSTHPSIIYNYPTIPNTPASAPITYTPIQIPTSSDGLPSYPCTTSAKYLPKSETYIPKTPTYIYSTSSQKQIPYLSVPTVKTTPLQSYEGYSGPCIPVTPKQSAETYLSPDYDNVLPLTTKSIELTYAPEYSNKYTPYTQVTSSSPTYSKAIKPVEYYKPSASPHICSYAPAKDIMSLIYNIPTPPSVNTPLSLSNTAPQTTMTHYAPSIIKPISPLHKTTPTYQRPTTYVCQTSPKTFETLSRPTLVPYSIAPIPIDSKSYESSTKPLYDSSRLSEYNNLVEIEPCPTNFVEYRKPVLPLAIPTSYEQMSSPVTYTSFRNIPALSLSKQPCTTLPKPLDTHTPSILSYIQPVSSIVGTTTYQQPRTYEKQTYFEHEILPTVYTPTMATPIYNTPIKIPSTVTYRPCYKQTIPGIPCSYVRKYIDHYKTSNLPYYTQKAINSQLPTYNTYTSLPTSKPSYQNNKKISPSLTATLPCICGDNIPMLPKLAIPKPCYKDFSQKQSPSTTLVQPTEYYPQLGQYSENTNPLYSPTTNVVQNFFTSNATPATLDSSILPQAAPIYPQVDATSYLKAPYQIPKIDVVPCDIRNTYQPAKYVSQPWTGPLTRPRPVSVSYIRHIENVTKNLVNAFPCLAPCYNNERIQWPKPEYIQPCSSAQSTATVDKNDPYYAQDSNKYPAGNTFTQPVSRIHSINNQIPSELSPLNEIHGLTSSISSYSTTPKYETFKVPNDAKFELPTSKAYIPTDTVAPASYDVPCSPSTKYETYSPLVSTPSTPYYTKLLNDPSIPKPKFSQIKSQPLKYEETAQYSPVQYPCSKKPKYETFNSPISTPSTQYYAAPLHDPSIPKAKYYEIPSYSQMKSDIFKYEKPTQLEPVQYPTTSYNVPCSPKPEYETSSSSIITPTTQFYTAPLRDQLAPKYYEIPSNLHIKPDTLKFENPTQYGPTQYPTPSYDQPCLPKLKYETSYSTPNAPTTQYYTMPILGPLAPKTKHYEIPSYSRMKTNTLKYEKPTQFSPGQHPAPSYVEPCSSIPKYETSYSTLNVPTAQYYTTPILAPKTKHYEIPSYSRMKTDTLKYGKPTHFSPVQHPAPFNVEPCLSIPKYETSYSPLNTPSVSPKTKHYEIPSYPQIKLDTPKYESPKANYGTDSYQPKTGFDSRKPQHPTPFSLPRVKPYPCYGQFKPTEPLPQIIPFSISPKPDIISLSPVTQTPSAYAKGYPSIVPWYVPPSDPTRTQFEATSNVPCQEFNSLEPENIQLLYATPSQYTSRRKAFEEWPWNTYGVYTSRSVSYVTPKLSPPTKSFQAQATVPLQSPYFSNRIPYKKANVYQNLPSEVSKTGYSQLFKTQPSLSPFSPISTNVGTKLWPCYRPLANYVKGPVYNILKSTKPCLASFTPSLPVNQNPSSAVPDSLYMQTVSDSYTPIVAQPETVSISPKQISTYNVLETSPNFSFPCHKSAYPTNLQTYALTQNNIPFQINPHTPYDNYGEFIQNQKSPVSIYSPVPSIIQKIPTETLSLPISYASLKSPRENTLQKVLAASSGKVPSYQSVDNYEISKPITISPGFTPTIPLYKTKPNLAYSSPWNSKSTMTADHSTETASQVPFKLKPCQMQPPLKFKEEYLQPLQALDNKYQSFEKPKPCWPMYSVKTEQQSQSGTALPSPLGYTTEFPLTKPTSILPKPEWISYDPNQIAQPQNVINTLPFTASSYLKPCQHQGLAASGSQYTFSSYGPYYSPAKKYTRPSYQEIQKPINLIPCALAKSHSYAYNQPWYQAYQANLSPVHNINYALKPIEIPSSRPISIARSNICEQQIKPQTMNIAPIPIQSTEYISEPLDSAKKQHPLYESLVSRPYSKQWFATEQTPLKVNQPVQSTNLYTTDATKPTVVQYSPTQEISSKPCSSFQPYICLEPGIIKTQPSSLYNEIITIPKALPYEITSPCSNIYKLKIPIATNEMETFPWKILKNLPGSLITRPANLGLSQTPNVYETVGAKHVDATIANTDKYDIIQNKGTPYTGKYEEYIPSKTDLTQSAPYSELKTYTFYAYKNIQPALSSSHKYLAKPCYETEFASVPPTSFLPTSEIPHSAPTNVNPISSKLESYEARPKISMAPCISQPQSSIAGTSQIQYGAFQTLPTTKDTIEKPCFNKYDSIEPLAYAPSSVAPQLLTTFSNNLVPQSVESGSTRLPCIAPQPDSEFFEKFEFLANKPCHKALPTLYYSVQPKAYIPTPKPIEPSYTTNLYQESPVLDGTPTSFSATQYLENNQYEILANEPCQKPLYAKYDTVEPLAYSIKPKIKPCPNVQIPQSQIYGQFENIPLEKYKRPWFSNYYPMKSSTYQTSPKYPDTASLPTDNIPNIVDGNIFETSPQYASTSLPNASFQIQKPIVSVAPCYKSFVSWPCKSLPLSEYKTPQIYAPYEYLDSAKSVPLSNKVSYIENTPDDNSNNLVTSNLPCGALNLNPTENIAQARLKSTPAQFYPWGSNFWWNNHYYGRNYDYLASTNPTIVMTKPCFYLQGGNNQHKLPYAYNNYYKTEDTFGTSMATNWLGPYVRQLAANIQYYDSHIENLKEKVLNNKQVSIDLGNAAIVQCIPDSCELVTEIKTSDPSINVKTWRSKVKLLKTRLVIDTEERWVTNFVPVVKACYASDKVANVAKNDITAKFGDTIVVNGYVGMYKPIVFLCNDDYSKLMAGCSNILWMNYDTARYQEIYNWCCNPNVHTPNIYFCRYC